MERVAVFGDAMPRGTGLSFHQFVDALARCGLIAFSPSDGHSSNTGLATTPGIRWWRGRQHGGASSSYVHAGDRMQAMFITHMKLLDRKYVDEAMGLQQQRTAVVQPHHFDLPGNDGRRNAHQQGMITYASEGEQYVGGMAGNGIDPRSAGAWVVCDSEAVADTSSARGEATGGPETHRAPATLAPLPARVAGGSERGVVNLPGRIPVALRTKKKVAFHGDGSR